jgi:hypothetical protein
MNRSFSVAAVALALALGGCSPSADSPVTSEASGEVIVGVDGIKSPMCTHEPLGVPGNAANVVARYVRGDTGEVCSGVLVTQDNLFLIPLRCKSANPVKLGHAMFAIYPFYPSCEMSGPPTPDPAVYRADNEDVGVDYVNGLALVHLGKGGFPYNTTPQTPQQNHGTAALGINKGATTHLTLRSDELFTIGSHETLLGFSENCGVTSTGSTSHTCDTLGNPLASEKAQGGGVFYHRNGCVNENGVGGTCNPGTGPQTPGAGIGRLVGIHLGPDGNGANRLVYLSALTGPGGLLTPFLTPGNFVP